MELNPNMLTASPGGVETWRSYHLMAVSTEAVGTLQMLKNIYQRKEGGWKAGTGRGRREGRKEAKVSQARLYNSQETRLRTTMCIYAKR